MEEAKLKPASRQQFDPLTVTQSLGYQTFRREARRPWTKDEDEHLKRLVIEQYMDSHNDDNYKTKPIPLTSINWDTVAEKLPERKAFDCKKRWANSIDPTVKKGKWTKEEDTLLLEAFQTYGTSWQKVSTWLVGRTKDQCAKRYVEVLDPNKDRFKPWNKEEDLELIRLVQSVGTKWRTISMNLPGRPSLTCRNRWRKLVTTMVRGKADPDIHKEMEKVQKKKEVLGSTIKSPEGIDSDKTPNPKAVPSAKNVSHPQSTSSASPPQPLQKASPNLVHSHTEWTFNTTGVEGQILSTGSINSKEEVDRLVEQAKKYNIAITIHQHVHHHYGNPNYQKSVLDPETQLNRHQHFNYLGSLKNVPRLTSTSRNPSSTNLNQIDPHSNKVSGKESDLIRLLNQPPETSQSPSNFNSRYWDFGSSSKRQKVHNPEDSKNDTTTQNYRAIPTNTFHPHFAPDDIEEDIDFWDSLGKLADVNPVNTSASTPPVSQHHPLHYDNSQSKTQVATHYTNFHPTHQQEVNEPRSTAPFGPLYGREYEEDEDYEQEIRKDEPKVMDRAHQDEEDIPNDASSFGVYYNVFPTKQLTNGIATEQARKNSHKTDSNSEKSVSHDDAFGFFPFNPS
ncbi:hypothetical protein LJB42_000418 [Komagataella kurtzmanii]|nr:hypothetical protein LJB42_000418 [Komagataella kurtzmanii]